MDESDGSWFGSAAWGAPSTAETDGGEDSFAVSDVVRYECGALLGRGGMGRVFAAYDRRLGRMVALKEMDPDIANAHLAARFAHEVRISARLEHPGIVTVLDAGISASGEPYYTMRMIRGRSLLAAAVDGVDRLGLVRHFRDACEAVAYAHSVGVVHRDLKPENVMVGFFGETQVVDWGLALVLDEGTESGGVVGTPAYMAPEQGRGEPATRASDVFGLGATLFELLVGSAPPGSRSEIVTALSGTPRALAAIVEKALKPDPSDRYADAKQLAEEVTTWLDGRRVSAYNYSISELIVGVVRRFRVAFGIGAAALMIVLVLTVVFEGRTGAQRERALQAEGLAQGAEIVAAEARAQADENFGRVLLQRAEQAVTMGARAEAEILAAHAIERLGNDPRALGVLSRLAAVERPQLQFAVALAHCPSNAMAPDGRSLLCLGVGGSRLIDLPSGRQRWQNTVIGTSATMVIADGVALIREDEGRIHRVALDSGHSLGTVASVPGKRRLIGARNSSTVLEDTTDALRLIEASGETRTLSQPCAQRRPKLGLRADGLQLAVACRGGRVLLIDPVTSETRTLTTFKLEVDESWSRVLESVLPPKSTVAELSTVTFAGPGLVVVGTWKGDVVSIDVDSGAVLHQSIASSSPVTAVVASPSGRRVAIVTERQGVAIWNPFSGQFEARLPSRNDVTAAFVDDVTLAVAGKKATVYRLPAEPRPSLFSTGAGLSSLAWSPSGQFVAAVGGHGTVGVSSADTGALVVSVDAGELVVKDVTFHPTRDELMITGNRSRGVIRMAAPEWTPTYSGKFVGSRRIGWMAGDIVVANSWTRGWWHVGVPVPGTGRPVGDRVLTSTDDHAVDLAVSANGEFAAMLHASGAIIRLSAQAIEDERVMATVTGGIAVDVSNDGVRLVVGSSDQLLLVDGEGTVTADHPHGLVDVALSANGAWVATGALDGRLRLFSADTLTPRLVGPPHRERISEVRFSPDNQRVATASWDRTVRLWSLEPLRWPVSADTLETVWGMRLEEAIVARID